ncbi:tetratricopeptide repeat protein [Candidatus Thiosymbion oneisti]|uniref:tetratricopeptide repeat protein n=1 Tax=Candidatus Thiosymbion oneisti TaxID=589554 RepID=UPI000A8073C4|nr:tetratricopeptide repeat protein [Candidatus Thiosymbion oneisti]
MSIFKDFPTILPRLWDWLREHKPWAWVFSGIGVAVPIALVGWLVIDSSKHSPDITASASGNGVAVVATDGSNVTIQTDPSVAKTIDKAVEALSRELERKEQALADTRQRELVAQERERSLQAELAALKEAIAAIPKQTEIPDAQARIKEALAAAAEGNTTLAEAIFSEVEARKIAEGEAAKKSAYKEAAEAARHRGALAFLHDTNKAIAAYRRATELDPENADGWNQLGRLLRRTGALDNAEAAYRKVASLGNAEDDQEFLAVAYGNPGNVYRIRGDLDQAEAMYNKAPSY